MLKKRTHESECAMMNMIASRVMQAKQQAVEHAKMPHRSFGDPSGIRTQDTLIKSQVLCQLS